MTNKKDTIILVGAYGCGNKGDDAILEGLLSHIDDKYSCVVTCGNYGGIRELFNVKTLKCRMNEGMTLPVLMNILLFIIKYTVKCAGCRYVLIGGGSLLHDITKYNLLFFAILQQIASIFGKKVFYIGVGAGPITTDLGKRICRSVIGKAEKIYVRDIPDYRLLEMIGLKNIELTSDMAFSVKTNRTLADGILAKYGFKGKDYIAVTASEWFKSSNFWNKDKMDFSDGKKRMSELIRIMMRVSDYPALFIPTVFHDYKLGLELQEMIGGENFYVLPDKYNCKEMAAIVAQSRFLFGIRMHSLIFAIREGVPFLTSFYDKKVESLVKRCGMMEYSFDFENVTDDDFEKIVLNIMRNEKDISKRLKVVSSELGEMAQMTMDALINSEK